jgi:uncharacterized repeat protein (TIGR03803 family)
MRIVAFISFAVLASCSRMTNSSALPGGLLNGAPALGSEQSLEASASPAAMYPLTGHAYKSLYSFKGYNDGANPYAGLTTLNGTLYGTTGNGGSGCYGYECGTAFKVNTTGEEHVLYSFKGTDGEKPMAGLVTLDGTLYGTTTEGMGRPGCGGSSGECGTVFAMSTSGKEHILHRFKSATDGRYPSAPLIVVNGVLYGTTPFGGTNDNGTVFAVSTSSSEQVLYRFKGGTDGSGPWAGLIAINGALYGTTGGGGYSGCSRRRVGCGTVFTVSTSGEERVLYRFKDGTDGASPLAGLIVLNGRLYGTTYVGGASNKCNAPRGCGAVFEVSTSGKERVLYRFKGPPDGAYPVAPLIALHGTLYGTTSSGGMGCSSSGSLGCGTVFAVSTTGKERVLYRFKGNFEDGANPSAGLIVLDGTLYGTTAFGGTNDEGTVFRISP